MGKLHALRVVVVMRCARTGVMGLHDGVAWSLARSQARLWYKARMLSVSWQLVLELVRWRDMLRRSCWLQGVGEHVLDTLLLVLGRNEVIPNRLCLVRWREASIW